MPHGKIVSLEEWALDAEAKAEALGWDRPATLMVEGPDGKLQVYVLAVPAPPYELLRKVAPVPDARAVMFVSEGWTYPEAVSARLREMSEEELEAFHRAQPPSEHPDRIEVRNALAVTHDEEIILTRVRGEEPEVHHATKGRIGGRIIGELHRILHGHAKTTETEGV